jgi:bifunctional NMN adenylyltransferase/nudix hydrolase
MTNTQPRRFDHAVFIGRFEPFHNAHRRVIDKALAIAGKVIVLVGSSNKPRSTKDPFFFDERKVMIRSAFDASAASRLLFAPLRDFPYSDDRWMREVQQQVAALIVADNAMMNASAQTQGRPQGCAPPSGGGGLPPGGPRISVCLIGHFKDDSTDYLRMFPQWDLIEALNHEQKNATELRTLMYEAAREPDAAKGKWMLVQSAVPEGVHSFLKEFAKSEPFAQLAREHEFLRGYKAQFASLPYPPVFVTVDAVVVHSGHVLLIQRRAEPGKGLWALPGGFIDPGERLVDACIRELREETRLKLPEPVLRGSIKSARVFDKPDRSARGRTITHGFFFEFPSGELPPVKGGDDAAKARWVPLAEFFDHYEPQMFEDHFGIVSAFIGV